MCATTVKCTAKVEQDHRTRMHRHAAHRGAGWLLLGKVMKLASTTALKAIMAAESRKASRMAAHNVWQSTVASTAEGWERQVARQDG